MRSAKHDGGQTKPVREQRLHRVPSDCGASFAWARLRLGAFLALQGLGMRTSLHQRGQGALVGDRGQGRVHQAELSFNVLQDICKVCRWCSARAGLGVGLQVQDKQLRAHNIGQAEFRQRIPGACTSGLVWE